MAARWSRNIIKRKFLYMFCTQIPPCCCIKITYEQGNSTEKKQFKVDIMCYIILKNCERIV